MVVFVCMRGVLNLDAILLCLTTSSVGFLQCFIDTHGCTSKGNTRDPPRCFSEVIWPQEKFVLLNFEKLFEFNLGRLIVQYGQIFHTWSLGIVLEMLRCW